MRKTLLPVSHHPQRSEGDCLAACAAMALDYAGVACDYARLLRMLEVKPYGTPGSRVNNLVSLGVHVRYAQGTLSELFEHMMGGLPCIVLVRTSHLPYWTYATDHAVLIVGCDEQTVFINDPAFEQAPQQVSPADLELAWMEFDYRYAVIWR